MRANVALGNNAKEQALGYAQRALSIARNIRSSEPAGDSFWVAKIYRIIGDIHRSLGDTGSANEAWRNAYAAFPKGVAELPIEMAEYAMILQRLGRSADAQPRVRRLQQMGYRLSQANTA